MTDLSTQPRLQPSVGALLTGSLRTYLHLLRLLYQAWMREGEISREAVLIDGTTISLRRLFNLDGTTLCVPREDGSIRRIPASQVVRIIDRGDYGYPA